MVKYYAECEGYVFYVQDREIHAKKYDIFKILNHEKFDQWDQTGGEIDGDYKTTWDLVDMDILSDCETLFRDGWEGDFYDITDAWDPYDGEFSNGTSCDYFEEMPEAKKVNLSVFEDESRGLTPVFWI